MSLIKITLLLNLKYVHFGPYMGYEYTVNWRGWKILQGYEHVIAALWL